MGAVRCVGPGAYSGFGFQAGSNLLESPRPERPEVLVMIGNLSEGLDWYQISFQSLFRKPIGSIIRFLFPLSGLIDTLFNFKIRYLNIPSNYSS